MLASRMSELPPIATTAVPGSRTWGSSEFFRQLIVSAITAFWA